MKPRQDSEVYCPDYKGGKLQFLSRKKARDFIRKNRIEIEEENGKAPVRPYWCDKCGCWHVTSAELHPREPGKKPRIGTSIDPWLTEVYGNLVQAVRYIELGDMKNALYSVQDTIPIIFWEIRMTPWKVEEKSLQKRLKEVTQELGKELKSIRGGIFEESRLLYYREKLLSIGEEGGEILLSEDRKDTNHLTIILEKKEDPEYNLWMEIIFKMRKLSSMKLIGSREENIQKNWEELEEMMGKVTNPEILGKLEYMRDLLY